jgi:hypothetical protein
MVTYVLFLKSKEVTIVFVITISSVSALNASPFICLCIHSLTGGTGTTGLSTSMTIPAVSVLGAPPTVAPVLRPTVPGLGLIPGAALPVTAQSAEVAVLSECLLLKNMFDPAMEVSFFYKLDMIVEGLGCHQGDDIR